MKCNRGEWVDGKWPQSNFQRMTVEPAALVTYTQVKNECSLNNLRAKMIFFFVRNYASISELLFAKSFFLMTTFFEPYTTG